MRFYLNGIFIQNISKYIAATETFPYWTLYFEKEDACEFIHMRKVDAIRIEEGGEQVWDNTEK